MKTIFCSYYFQKLTPALEKLDEYYQQTLYYNDISVENYRAFIIITRDKNLTPVLSDLVKNVFHSPVPNGFMDMLSSMLDTLRGVSVSYKNLIQTFLGAKTETIGKIYLDRGNGYKEQDIIDLHGSIENHFSYVLKLPADVKRFRFDPIDGISCIIRNIIFKVNDQDYKYTCNGVSIGDSTLFASSDPQYEIIMENSSEYQIEICGEIGFINNNAAQAIIQTIDESKVKLEEFKETSEKLVLTTREKLASTTRKLKQAREESANSKKEILHLNNSLANMRRIQEELQRQNVEIFNSTSWKITRPLRLIKEIIIKFKSFFKRLRKLLHKAFICWKSQGFKYTFRMTIKKIKSVFRPQPSESATDSFVLSRKRRRLQESYNFSRNIKISILVPLYNTPELFLQEVIQSVKNQTYKNWELCFADGSDSEHKYVKILCEKAANLDRRINYKTLTENLGISENTNRCIEMSTGEYLGLLDHDDILHPSALFEVMKAINEKDADFIYTDENTFTNKPECAYNPHYKPDFSPDMLRSQNYICHFTVYARKLLDKVGLYRSQFDGSQDYDMVLRLTEAAEKIVHIPKILYFWRASDSSVASNISAKSYAINSAKAAIKEHLDRLGLDGNVEDSIVTTTYRICYAIKGNPLVSIMIPNKDHVPDLKNCIDSILRLSTYKNYEIIIIENGSKSKSTFAYYDSICSKNKNITVVVWDGPFNYSAINNYGFKYTHGEQIILLNNDIVIITPDWIQEMLMFSQREGVGAVGAMLYYPDNTIQHAGVIVGIGGVAGHSHKYFKRGSLGYMGRITFAQNLSAVTAACMMLPRKVFEEMNGLDEEFVVAFNDVDFCMRIRKAGYLIVFTPFAELYHCESKSRGYEDTPEKQERFSREIFRFQRRWEKELEEGDPYYNPNLTLDHEDFSIK